MAGLNCEIKWETRLCEVNGELGYFHCWEHWSNVIDTSPLRGGHPGGQDLAIKAGNTEIQEKVEKQIRKINEKLKF